MEEAAMSQEALELTPSQEIENAVQKEGQETAQEVLTQENKPEQPKEESIPKGVQKRIDRAVRQKYEAEARANELERRLQQLEQQSRRPEQTKVDGEPRLEQFENIEDYVSAKAAYVADQRIQQTLTARERAEAEKQAQAAQIQSAESWNKRVQLVTAELPDFADVVSSSDIRFKEPLALEAIRESDIGPKIAYYLASNPDEADEIAGMRGLSAVRAIGRIEARLSSEKASVTKTPPPIEPAGTKAKAVKTPDQMSDSEFAAWRKKFIKER